MTYSMWQVFEEGCRTKFYIVNKKTKQVQSVWTDYIQASVVLKKLNQVTKVA